MSAFPALFSPLRLGCYTLANRIMNTGHAAHFQTGDGLPTERYVDYVRERAKGGAGIIVTGHTVPYHDGDNVISWQPHTIENIDTVVFAAGGAADDALYHALAGRIAELHCIGDAYQARDIEVAVVDGHRAGRAL